MREKRPVASWEEANTALHTKPAVDLVRRRILRLDICCFQPEEFFAGGFAGLYRLPIPPLLPWQNVSDGLSCASMNMPRIIFTFAVIFVLLGIGAYLATGAQSWTALIPSIFGLLLAIAGGISLKSLKHGGHIAALVGLLGFLGTAKSLGKLPALLKGEVVERAAAVGVQASFAILSLIFVALCVKSFIDARKARS